MSFFTILAQWWQKPFNSQGSALNWAAFVFLIFLACAIWAQVLAPITAKGIGAVKDAV